MGGEDGGPEGGEGGEGAGGSWRGWGGWDRPLARAGGIMTASCRTILNPA